MREPDFWWRRPGLWSALLAPAGAIYGAVARKRMDGAGAPAGVPVICVGNFTLGGSGKTPTAIAIAELLSQAGMRPVLLSRGYGGMILGPVTVDSQRHTSAEVGDEPLLLANAGVTVVSQDRVAGAQAARSAGADVLVMDDGLQNASLGKDFTLAVVDGRRGVGNAKVFPAGPLRAPLNAQFARINALLVIGGNAGAAGLDREIRARRLPVFHGVLEPDRTSLAPLSAHAVLAFAGIGDPEKFFTTLETAGVNVKERRAFPDHHRYSAEEAGALIMQAERQGLRLVTTAKDHARIGGDPAIAALAARAHVIPVRLQVKEEAAWRDIILRAAKRINP